jgi:ribonuclease HI
MDDYIDIYVDGSFKDGQALWAFVVVENDTMIYGSNGRLNGPINEMRQVGGELKAVIQAICYARRVGRPARIFHDYNGISKWVADGWGGKAWNCGNQWTQQYRDFVLKNRQHVHSFVKVKGHTGDKWNEEADRLAGLA